MTRMAFAKGLQQPIRTKLMADVELFPEFYSDRMELAVAVTGIQTQTDMPKTHYVGESFPVEVKVTGAGGVPLSGKLIKVAATI